MHDAIYENQSYLNEDFLLELAEKLDLNISQFKNDLEKTELADKVDADFESGVLSGVNGTPSFFINDKKFDGSAMDLLELIRANAS